MKMYIDSAWVDSDTVHPVHSPYTHEQLDTVPDATSEQVEATLAAAERGARTMARLTGYERSQILNRAADLCAESQEDQARASARGAGGTMPGWVCSG